jgi:hypothetical protein
VNESGWEPIVRGRAPQLGQSGSNEHTPEERTFAVNYGIVGILVIILLILAVVYFARRV